MFEIDSAFTVIAKKKYLILLAVLANTPPLSEYKLTVFFPLFSLSLLNCMMYNPKKVTGSKQHSKLRELLGPTNGLHVSSSAPMIFLLLLSIIL